MQEHGYVCIDSSAFSSTVSITLTRMMPVVLNYWIDHFICVDAFAAMVGSVVPLYRGANLSDQLPITIILDWPVIASTPDFVTLDLAISTIEVNQCTDWQSVFVALIVLLFLNSLILCFCVCTVLV